MKLIKESENFCEASYTEMYYSTPPSVCYRILEKDNQKYLEIDAGVIKKIYKMHSERTLMTRLSKKTSVVKLSDYQTEQLEYFLGIY